MEDKETIENILPFLNTRFNLIWMWLTKMYIKVWKEFTIGLLITGLELKEWIDEEYEMNFLQQSVKDIEEQLENESTSGDNTLYEINKVF